MPTKGPEYFLATLTIKVNGQEFETTPLKFKVKKGFDYFDVKAVNIYVGSEGEEKFVSSIKVN